MDGQRKCGILLYVNIIQSLKGSKLPLEITWMNLEGIMLSEISQSQKEKYS
jgi:hypothetical protein